MSTVLTQPVAERLRPVSLDHFYGQHHLLAKGKPLYEAIQSGSLHSMILWGPPGTGKTTIARMIARQSDAQFIPISAVLAGVKEIREAVAKAQQVRKDGVKTIVFVDEVHRFNKAQQDAFLPFVEDGTFYFIGATTENPSFEVNNALLSRARVYVLKSLSDSDLLALIDHAMTSEFTDIDFSPEIRQQFVTFVDGDARRLLNLIELAVQLVVESGTDAATITQSIAVSVLEGSVRRYDKGGEEFYNQISALHKSIRGSSPDASLYWMCRMLDGGCDPHYIARRLIRIASEDIGNADPRALTLTLDAAQVQERLGSPEGELALAQAVTYLAAAPKSNAVYRAFQCAQQDAKQTDSSQVPVHLRNAPTRLMKQLGYGKHYRYAHDEPDAYAAGEHYFPEDMPQKRYYQPVNRGLEIKISEKLNRLALLDENASKPTKPNA
ncbi:MAG: replication-associated recombination protein A [Gammaproteobacteria bacterium]|nr:replication-associated recombination protein A [Gammaproteobacteria bacterium]